MKIGTLNIEGRAFLAPMAGITDCAFRYIASEMGASLVYTEMVSALSLRIDPYREAHLRYVYESHAPTALQIFGRDAQVMAQTALSYSAGFDMVDINMGCPAQKIVKGGQGSALLKDLSTAGEIIRAVSTALDKPLSVKTRAGWDDEHIVAEEFALMAEENGAAAITLHPRTREQFYSGHSSWELIARVKEHVHIPVIGNGDITNAQDAAQMLRQTRCDAVMIGRGALGNPFIFREINALLEGHACESPTYAEKAETLLRQFELLSAQKGERRAALEIRKHAAWYIRGLTSSSELKRRAFEISTRDDVLRFTDELISRSSL